MGSLPFVFQYLASLGVHPNFLSHPPALNVERIAKSGPTFFFLQLLIGDLTRVGLQSDRAGLGYAYLSFLRQFLSRVGHLAAIDADAEYVGFCGKADIPGTTGCERRPTYSWQGSKIARQVVIRWSSRRSVLCLPLHPLW